MAKVLAGREGAILGIASSREMFDKLKFESTRLQREWHCYDAFNFLVTAWHLFEDWPKSDAPQAPCRIKRHRRRLPESMNLVLNVVRDIVNGSKHFQLTPDAAAKRCVEEIHTGEEVGWYEYFFHEDLPAVTVDEHWYFSIRVLKNLVVRYFEWTFDDTVPVDEFPPDLLDAIDYCNIAKRRSGPSPEIWLQGIKCAYKTGTS